MFCHFWQKFKNSKWPPFLGRGTCLKIGNITFLDTPWVKNFDEITLSHTVKEKEEFCVFEFSAKIRKFKMAAIFGEGKIF